MLDQKPKKKGNASDQNLFIHIFRDTDKGLTYFLGTELS